MKWNLKDTDRAAIVPSREKQSAMKGVMRCGHVYAITCRQQKMISKKILMLGVNHTVPDEGFEAGVQDGRTHGVTNLNICASLIGATNHII